MEKKLFRSLFSFIALSLIIPALFLAGCTDKAGDLSNPKSGTFSPTGTIQGQITDRFTNKPISGAKVSVASASGVQTAVTGNTGLYSIANLPATTDVGGNSAPTGTYTINLDLTDVNAALKAAAPVGTTPSLYSANVVLGAVTVQFTSLNDCIPGTPGTVSNTGCNDTQVQGLTNVFNIPVGKLAANLTGTVRKIIDRSPEASATVQLRSGGTTDTATGANLTGTALGGNLVATATTDVNGSFAFNNIEAGAPFFFVITSADGLRNNGTGSGIIAAPGDGLTLNVNAGLAGIQPAPRNLTELALGLGAIDGQGPQIVATTPTNGTDLPPGSDAVVTFKFNEPIKQTPFTATTSTGNNPPGRVDTLFDEIIVNFDGLKAGNIKYTLAWDTAFQTLSVTVPTTQLAPASRYSVQLLAPTLVKLTDAANNPAGFGAAAAGVQGATMRVGSGCVTAVGGTVASGTAVADPCIVNFTTSGSSTVTAPTLSLVNTASLDQTAAGIGPILKWNPVSGAIGYRLFRSQVQAGVAGSSLDITGTLAPLTPAGHLAGTEIVDTTLGAGGLTGFVGNSTFAGGRFFGGTGQVKYNYNVAAVGLGNAVGTSSTTVTAADGVGPSLTGVAALACVATSPATVPAGTVAGFICDSLAVANPNVTDILATFSEPLDRSTVEIAGNYTLAFGTAGTGTVPTVSSVFYNELAAVFNGAPAGGVRLTLSTKTPISNFQQALTTGPNGITDGAIVAATDVVLNGINGTTVGGLPNAACVTENAAGTAATAAAGDDVQAIAVGAVTTVGAVIVNAGPNGICQTAAAGGETQAIAVGQGAPNTPFAAPGINGTFETAFAGDNTVAAATTILTVTGVKDIAGNVVVTTGDELLSSGGTK